VIAVFAFVSELVVTAAVYEVGKPWEASRGEVLSVCAYVIQVVICGLVFDA